MADEKQQPKPQAAPPAPQRRLDEAPEDGAVYIVNNVKVGPDGKPINAKD